MSQLATKEKITVLIVDRKESSRVLEKNISRSGHNVLVADCYSDAMKKTAGNDCDLIVMNIDLPDWNRSETISKIRKLTGNISIVTMTDSNNREQEQEVREQRILYYAVKPLELSEINSIIDHIHLKKQVQSEELITL